MTALRALVEHFVAPAGEDVSRPAAPRNAPAATHVPPAVGLLCGPRHARAVGCMVALCLARRTRSRAALAAVWGPGVPPSPGGAPPSREARRVAQALGARDVPAQAVGRVVVAALPAAQEDAAVAAGRVFAVAADLPTVLVLAGPRDAPLDALLATRDVVLVADERDGLVTDLAVASLQRRGISARRCALPAPPFAAVAARGAAVLPAARRGLDLALEGLV